MKKNIEKSEAPTRIPTTLAPVIVRRRKIEKGTSGARERRSIATKAISRIAAAARTPIVCAEPQPASSASSRAKTRAERPRVIVVAPATSKFRTSCSARDSAIRRGASAAAAIPIGTLTQSTHSQPRYSVRTPPRRTPAAPPEPATAPQIPSALLRSAPSRKVVATIESAAGERIAAPRPCTARAATSCPEVLARPPASEASAKSTSPNMKTRRRPSRSASRPPSRRKPPKVST